MDLNYILDKLPLILLLIAILSTIIKALRKAFQDIEPPPNQQSMPPLSSEPSFDEERSKPPPVSPLDAVFDLPANPPVSSEPEDTKDVITVDDLQAWRQAYSNKKQTPPPRVPLVDDKSSSSMRMRVLELLSNPQDKRAAFILGEVLQRKY